MSLINHKLWISSSPTNSKSFLVRLAFSQAWILEWQKARIFQLIVGKIFVIVFKPFVILFNSKTAHVNFCIHCCFMMDYEQRNNSFDIHTNDLCLWNSGRTFWKLKNKVKKKKRFKKFWKKAFSINFTLWRKPKKCALLWLSAELWEVHKRLWELTRLATF